MTSSNTFYQWMNKPRSKSGALLPLFRDIKLSIFSMGKKCLVAYVTTAQIVLSFKAPAVYRVAFHPPQSFASGVARASYPDSPLACWRGGNLTVHHAAQCSRCPSFESADKQLKCIDSDPDGNSTRLCACPPEISRENHSRTGDRSADRIASLCGRNCPVDRFRQAGCFWFRIEFPGYRPSLYHHGSNPCPDLCLGAVVRARRAYRVCRNRSPNCRSRVRGGE